MRLIKPINKNKSGFTMIELISVIVILGILGTGLSMIFASSAKIFVETRSENELALKTWIALERISRELNHATVVTLPVSPAAGSILQFKRNQCTGCVDSSQDITFTYTPTDGKLWRISNGAGARELADNVSSFEVTASGGSNETAKLFKISITRFTRSPDGNIRTLTIKSAVHPQAMRDKTWMEPVR